jgi:hypothetical protein
MARTPKERLTPEELGQLANEVEAASEHLRRIRRLLLDAEMDHAMLSLRTIRDPYLSKIKDVLIGVEADVRRQVGVHKQKVNRRKPSKST